jgi:hypothetical protein
MNPVRKSKREEGNNLQYLMQEKALLEMHASISQFFDSQQIDIISLLNEAQCAYFRHWKSLTKEEVLTRMESFSNVTSLISNLATNQKSAKAFRD